jgi:hypothetical protein
MGAGKFKFPKGIGPGDQKQRTFINFFVPLTLRHPRLYRNKKPCKTRVFPSDLKLESFKQKVKESLQINMHKDRDQGFSLARFKTRFRIPTRSKRGGPVYSSKTVRA